MGVASVSILVSDSDVSIQQTRIGDRIVSIGSIWIGCGGCFWFYFGFQFTRSNMQLHDRLLATVDHSSTVERQAPVRQSDVDRRSGNGLTPINYAGIKVYNHPYFRNPLEDEDH